jgi:hypothetical protein
MWLKKVADYSEDEKRAEFDSMAPEDKAMFEELDREVEEFKKDMTPEDKADFESFVPKSE